MTKRFAGPRGSGRTTALVNWVKEFPQRRVLVVKNAQRAAWVKARFGPKIGVYTIDQVVGFGGSQWIYGIDDYDCFPETAVTEMRLRGMYIGAVVVESDDYENLTPPLTDEEIIAGLREMELELRG